MHSSKVYSRLGERIGLRDHLAVLNVILTKVATNLKVFGASEEVISLTLTLFQVRVSVWGCVGLDVYGCFGTSKRVDQSEADALAGAYVCGCVLRSAARRRGARSTGRPDTRVGREQPARGGGSADDTRSPARRLRPAAPPLSSIRHPRSPPHQLCPFHTPANHTNKQNRTWLRATCRASCCSSWTRPPTS